MPAIYNHPQANEAMRRIHEQLDEIGQEDPQRATHLSHKVLNCNWFHWEVQKLKAEGLVIDDCLIYPGLKGGMMEEEMKSGAAKTSLVVSHGTESQANQQSENAEDGAGALTVSQLSLMQKISPRARNAKQALSLDDYELLQQKLKNPQMPLSIEQSIELLTRCIAYGDLQAEKATGTENVIMIGSYGSGVSTLGNALCGCHFKLVSLRELGVQGLVKAVVVKDHKEGGPRDEVMKIGHSKNYKTYITQVAGVDGQSYTLADCPNILVNRGSEINIANTINLAKIMSKAKRVKVVLLINFHSLLADRGRGLTEMLKIALFLFGTPENILKNKESILIGVTHVPLEEDSSLEDIQGFVAEDPNPMMATLAERFFIYDPLDRPVRGSVTVKTLQENIEKLLPISNPGHFFQASLTIEDNRKLLEVCDAIASKIEEAMVNEEFGEAATFLDSLQNLSLIENTKVLSIIVSSRLRIERYFRAIIDEFHSCCHSENFKEAKSQFSTLTKAIQYFDREMQSTVNLEQLKLFYGAGLKKAQKVQKLQEELKEVREKQQS